MLQTNVGRYKKNLILLLSYLFIFPATCSADDNEKKVVLSAIDQPGAIAQDIFIAVLTEAYKNIGYTIEVKKVPSERALLMAQTDAVDGVLARVRGIEKMYPNLIPVDVRIYVVKAVVFSKRHHFQVKGWESLRPYSIGIRNGIKYAEKGTFGMNVEAVDSLRQLFYKLDLERSDIVICVDIVGVNAIRQFCLKDIHVLEPPLATFDLFHYLNKKHSDTLLPLISSALQKMESDGRIEQIWIEMRHKLLADE